MHVRLRLWEITLIVFSLFVTVQAFAADGIKGQVLGGGAPIANLP